MKQIFLIAVAIVTVFSSCSKDDDTNPLIGTWGLYSISVLGIEKVHDECIQKTTVTFTKDTFSSSSWEENLAGDCKEIENDGGRVNVPYTISGNKIVGTSEEGKTEEMTFAVNGNYLTRSAL